MLPAEAHSLLDILAPVARPSPLGKGTDLQQLRRWNRLLVLNCIRTHGGISRAEVAELTDLSRPTVTTIVDALMQDGLLREGPSPPPTAGQRGRMIPLHFNAQVGYAIGVDMGRNHLTVIISDLAAEIVAERHFPFAMSRGPATCLAELCAAIQEVVQARGIAWRSVVGIGVGMPGPMDATLSFPAAPPGMPEWDGVPLREHLHATFGVPVYLDNNANMGALGENRYGGAQGVANLIYMKLDTGIGCGLIIEHRLFRGGCGSAGEIGHNLIDPDGTVCVCGNRGCLETVASSAAICAAARHDGQPLPTFAAVIAGAEANDPLCRASLAQAGNAIGIALAALVNTINPTLIVLDGATMQADAYILAPAREQIARHCLRAPLAHVQMVRGSLASEAVSRGAIATVLDSVFLGASTSKS